MKSIKKQVPALLLALGLASGMSACADKYNVSDQNKMKDVRAKDSYIYGEKDAKPRQLGTEYPELESAQADAKIIREKFFGSNDSKDGGTPALNKDTARTKAVDTSAAKKGA